MHNRPEIWNGVKVPYDVSVEDLARLAQGTAPHRWAAFVALAHLPDDSALAFLQESAESPDPHVRRIAVEALGVHPDGPRASTVIVRLLADSHGIVVRSACEAARRQQLAEAHDSIIRLLNSPEDSTRRVAVRTLRSMWRESDLDRILEIFTSDPSSEVKKEAAWTLQAAGSESNWRQLFAMWQADSLPRHRRWAVELAGAFGDVGTLPQVQRLAADVDGHVRHRATQAIVEIEARAAKE
jgi:HEAT repeat protein